MTPKKPVRINGKMPPPTTYTLPAELAPKKPKRNLEIDSDVPPSIELLNSATIFQRRIKFVWVRRRGSVIQAGLPDGRIAEWLDATDLRTFSRSQDILLQATDFLIPTPPRRAVTEVWEPVAQLIRNVAKHDAEEMENPLKDEFRHLIRSVWLKAGGRHKAYVETADAFFEILKECQTTRRNPKAEFPPRSCIWGGGKGEMAQHYCWIYQESLMDWLSTPSGKDKHYPWDRVRHAFSMLGLQNRRLHETRTLDGTSEELWVRIWQGPIDLLIDPPEKPARLFPIE